MLLHICVSQPWQLPEHQTPFPDTAWYLHQGVTDISHSTDLISPSSRPVPAPWLPLPPSQAISNKGVCTWGRECVPGSSFIHSANERLNIRTCQMPLREQECLPLASSQHRHCACDPQVMTTEGKLLRTGQHSCREAGRPLGKVGVEQRPELCG